MYLCELKSGVMIHYIYRCVMVALVAMLTGLGAVADVTSPRELRRHRLDSLQHKLERLNRNRDILAVQLDIFDLQESSRDKFDRAQDAYRTAVMLGDTITQLEMIMHQANAMWKDPQMLDSMMRKLAPYPSTPRVDEIRLFVDLLRTAIIVREDTSAIAGEEMKRLMSDFVKNPPSTASEKVKMLFSICTHLEPHTHGPMLIGYANSLFDIIETADFPVGAVRNLIYARAAPVFTNNNHPDIAVALDKKLLNVIDSLQRDYQARGREFRVFDTNRYICFKRLLGNYRVLKDEEVDQYYLAINDMARQNTSIKADVEKTHLPDAFYLLAKGNDREAIPLLLKAAEVEKNRIYSNYIYTALYEAATRTGNRDVQLGAALEMNRILQQQINDATRDRYNELQISYDIAQFQQQNSELEGEKLRAERRLYMWIVGIGTIVIVLLLAFAFVLWRQRNSQLRMSAKVQEVADRLRKEKSELFDTQQKLIEAHEVAHKADSLKTEFINNLSHEMSAPLNAISEYSRLIVDCIPDDNQNYLDRFANTIETNVKIVRALLGDVQDIATLESDTMMVRREPANIYNICETAIDNVFDNNSAANPNVEFRFNADDRPDQLVITDSQRVVQVLVNLLSNARKFTEKGFIDLEFCVDKDAGKATFTVTDSGIGIPADKADAVFGRFYKIDKNADGAGLGLYICRLIAGRLDGTIAVDTDYRGGGTRMIFTIPV